METRTPTWTQLWLPIGFALVTVAAMIGIWVSFGGSLPFAAGDYRLRLELGTAQNIYPGSDVQIAGVTIGRVSEVRTNRRDAKVTISIDRQFAPLHSGAYAITRSKTLLGEGYIEIAPGPKSAPAVPDGGVLPISHVLPSQQLDQALHTFNPTTRRNIGEMFAGLSKALRGRARALSDSVGNAAPASSDLASVARLLADQQPQLQRTIASAGQVLGAVGERQGVLEAAVRSANAVLGATAARNSALSATITALAPFLVQLRNTSGTLASASPDFNRAADALLPLAPALAPGLRSIDIAAPQFRGLFRQLPGVIGAGHRGLPAATAIVNAAGSSFTQVYPATRQVIPFFQLASAIDQSIVAFLANVGSASATSYVGPGGYITHTVNGIPSIWNETIAGWVKKLPSNVQNAYPAPGSASQVANGGLRAYDCRNTHNPLFLPPTGTGSPPCITQGPWVFDGKSRYYPHLTQAPP
jgi:phospholipid/cholesterol/gamma-HCH transport system substrate-binding protein